jgi:hypothetical protein
LGVDATEDVLFKVRIALKGPSHRLLIRENGAVEVPEDGQKWARNRRKFQTGVFSQVGNF